MSDPAQRRAGLVQTVEEQGYCTIAELARQFKVSEMTIRRDVVQLVDRGVLRSFHGGVSRLQPQEIIGSDYRLRAGEHDVLKERLAAAAITQLDDGSVVGFDAGTTVAAVARQLPPALTLRAVTASLPVITALAPLDSVELTALGGVFHDESLSFAGQATLDASANLSIDTLLLAASGLSEQGAYCANDFDALTKRALIEASHRVVLVADSSKFRSRAMVKVCSWSSVDLLVIDDGIEPERRAQLESAGVEVLTVTRE